METEQNKNGPGQRPTDQDWLVQLLESGLVTIEVEEIFENFWISPCVPKFSYPHDEIN